MPETIKIILCLLGELGRQATSNTIEMNVPQGATVAKAIELLGLRPGEVWITTIDGQLVDKDYLLCPGDKLSLLPPVGGGN